MSPLLEQALVVVKWVWGQFGGGEPLLVQLAVSSGDRQWAWEKEALRWLDYVGMCNQRQRRADFCRFVRGQERPGFWDEHIVGEHPGTDDPILRKEFRYRKVYYQSGPVREGVQVARAPQI